MSEHQRFVLHGPPIVHETLDGETVVINLQTGAYYSLCDAGAAVWQALEHGADLDDVVSAASEVAEDNIDLTAAAQGLLAELLAEGLVEQLGNGPASLPDAAADRPEAFALRRFTDLGDLLLMDPIHEVDESGWPLPRSTA